MEKTIGQRRSRKTLTHESKSFLSLDLQEQVEESIGIKPRTIYTAEEAVSTLRAHFKSAGVETLVAVLGSTKFKDPTNQDLVAAIARQIKEKCGPGVGYITGGMPGVQSTFAENLDQDAPLWNLVPHGNASNFSVGEDIEVGHSAEEEKSVLGRLADIYITVEGGPGVAHEAKDAKERGAQLVPVIRSGGASSGMFDCDFLLKQPLYVEDAEWSSLQNHDSPIEESAGAVVKVVMMCVKARAILTSKERDQLDTTEIDPGHTMCGGQCAVQ